MTKEQAAQDIEKLLSDNVGIDVTIDESDLEYGMDVDELERVVDIDRAISEQCEIIYYSNAMEFRLCMRQWIVRRSTDIRRKIFPPKFLRRC